MSDISPQDAAFEGFRLTREHPVAIPVFAVLQFATSMLVFWAFISSGYLAGMENMMTVAQSGGKPDSAALEPVVAAFLGKMLLVFPFILAVDAILRASVARMVLSPGVRGLGVIRVGGAEVRVFVARLILCLVLVLGGVLGMTLLSLSILMGGAIGGFVAFLSSIATLALIVAISIRFSLAPAACVAGSSLGLRESWELTQGRFWPIFGAYVLAVLLFVVVIAAGSLIEQVPLLAFGQATADTSSFAAYMTAPRAVLMLFGAFFSALGSLILYAPGAVIYRRLSDHGVADAF